ncbi:hypothetical protein PC110_g2729 [Phytophthora cactorum]|uniref:Uncharacterized protein n=1 Tax=Phytophthora cactorum TaxID=29920 RepID=A0A329SYT4_9STRA|nr:hypothetical protein PC110_g2729 [Phytophthora cactorum]
MSLPSSRTPLPGALAACMGGVEGFICGVCKASKVEALVTAVEEEVLGAASSPSERLMFVVLLRVV